MDFTNKTVVITGASSGIGEASALAFAKFSAQLVLIGRNLDNLNTVSQSCEELSGIKPLIIQADVTNEDDVKRIVEQTLEQFGAVDVLVNNAGGASPESILNPSLKVFDDMFNLNLRSVYNLTTLFAPSLIETKGNIVNVSSVASTSPIPWSVCYSASKAALDHLTRLAAYELAPKGVRVNSVNPGLTVTNFQANMFQDEEQGKALIENNGKNIPLGKPCVPSEIADAVVYLASEQARSVTGIRFVVDGGIGLK